MVDDEGFFFAGKGTQHAADHLQPEDEGLGGTDDLHGFHAGDVEAFGDDFAVAENANVSVAELLDDAFPLGVGGVAVDVGGGDAGLVEGLGEVLGVVDADVEDDGLFAGGVFLPVFQNVGADKLFFHGFLQLFFVVVAAGCLDVVSGDGLGGAEQLEGAEVALLDEFADGGAGNEFVKVSVQGPSVAAHGGGADAEDVGVGVGGDEVAVGFGGGVMGFVDDD